MSHLALFKHETQAIKNPPATFQTVSLGTSVNKGIKKAGLPWRGETGEPGRQRNCNAL
jgi:hypothetical protein